MLGSSSENCGRVGAPPSVLVNYCHASWGAAVASSFFKRIGNVFRDLEMGANRFDCGIYLREILNNNNHHNNNNP